MIEAQKWRSRIFQKSPYKLKYYSPNLAYFAQNVEDNNKN